MKLIYNLYNASLDYEKYFSIDFTNLKEAIKKFEAERSKNEILILTVYNQKDDSNRMILLTSNGVCNPSLIRLLDPTIM